MSEKQHRISKKEEIDIAIFPLIASAKERYNLTATEAIMYGFLWNFLSQNRNIQMTVKSKDIGDVLGMKVDTVNSCIKKLANLGIINSRIVSDKEEGGKIRFITWNELIEYRLPVETKEEERVTGKNLVRGGNLEKHSSLYNNIVYNKDNINSISDSVYSNKRTGKKPVTLDTTSENQSKIKMSSIERNLPVKKKREFNEKEKEVFSIYKKLVWKNASEKMKIVKEGIPIVLKVFDTPQDFEQAVLNMLNDKKYWKEKLDTEVTRRAPNPFLKQSFLESYLLPMLYANKVKKKQDFSDDEDVKLVYKHSQEALEKLMANS